MDESERDITLRIPCRLIDVQSLGPAVRAVREAPAVGAAGAAQIELAIVEACNNVIKHALGEGADAEISPALRLRSDRIELELRDPGKEWLRRCRIQKPMLPGVRIRLPRIFPKAAWVCS